MLAAYPDKSAAAVCTFAYCGGPGEEVLLFQGRTQGKIVPARGPGTFGWDAVFEYEGQTYAEMEKERKVSPAFSFQLSSKASKMWTEFASARTIAGL